MQRTMGITLFCLLSFALDARGSTERELAVLGTLGRPALSGSLGGSVTIAGQASANLTVVADLGEISPINPNAVVRLSIPIAVYSTAPCRVTLSAAGGIGADARGLALSDIGFGIQNVRRLDEALRPLRAGNEGAGARPWPHRREVGAATLRPGRALRAARAAASSGRLRPVVAQLDGAAFVPPALLNDPAALARPGFGRRGTFPVSLERLVAQATVFDDRSRGASVPGEGWGFEAVVAVVPQFYPPGTNMITLTFTVQPGPEAYRSRHRGESP